MTTKDASSITADLLRSTPRDEQLLDDYNQSITALAMWIDFWVETGNVNNAKIGAETLFMLGYHAGHKPVTTP